MHVVRGDTVTLPYSLGMDIIGYEVWFAAKTSPADDTYAIGPMEVTDSVLEGPEGTGFIELSASDTDAAPRRYYAEIELRAAGKVLTPLRFFLWIDPDVIR